MKIIIACGNRFQKIKQRKQNYTSRINECLSSIRSTARILILTMTMGQFAVLIEIEKNKFANSEYCIVKQLPLEICFHFTVLIYKRTYKMYLVTQLSVNFKRSFSQKSLTSHRLRTKEMIKSTHLYCRKFETTKFISHGARNNCNKKAGKKNRNHEKSNFLQLNSLYLFNVGKVVLIKSPQSAIKTR